ncbi:MAG: tetratricopeptide repeat protein [Chlorobium sp.]|nr:MAG: tetratricopeptide repeat protein [Chlorobium sp.]
MSIKVNSILFLPLVILSACASKQDLVLFNDDLRKLKNESDAIKTQSEGSSTEIQQLRADIQKLKSETEAIKVQSAGSYSEAQQIRDEVFRLQGSFEGSNHKNSEAFKRLGMEDSLLVYKVDDLDVRLQKLEQFAGLGKQEGGVVQKKGDASLPAPMDDVALLKDGLAKLAQKNYVLARESFGALLKNHPKSELADRAQFQLAESYFGEKKYENAILAYQVVIAKYLKSSNRAAALFKQARSFEKIGDTVNALARDKDLLKVYPNSPEAGLVRKKQKSQ